MREVGAFEAKNKLGQLLDLVEQGEEVIITRHGKEGRAVGPGATQPQPGASPRRHPPNSRAR